MLWVREEPHPFDRLLLMPSTSSSWRWQSAQSLPDVKNFDAVTAENAEAPVIEVCYTVVCPSRRTLDVWPHSVGKLFPSRSCREACAWGWG